MKGKAMGIRIIFLSIFSLLIAISLIAINGQTYQTINSRADEAIDAERCPNPPACCQQIAETGDALQCSWDEGRGYCPPDVCSKISGKGQKCGWYWIWHDKDSSPDKNIGTNMPNGYGCMIGESEATMRPKYTSSGATTAPPRPTSPPSPTTFIPSTAPEPTSPPPPEPTVAPPPAVTIPTTPPQQPPPGSTFDLQRKILLPTPTIIPQSFTLPQLNLPQFTLPSFQIHLNGQRINEEAAKPLGFFESVFETVTHYDKLLEEAVNSTFHSVFK